MSLVERITALAQAIGADIKQLVTSVDQGFSGIVPQPSAGFRALRRYGAFGRITQLGGDPFPLPANALFPTPIYLNERATISQLYVQLTTGAVGANMKFALYRSNKNGGLGSKVYESANVPASAPGLLSVSMVNTTLDGGLYFLCVLFSAAVTIVVNANMAGFFLFGIGSSGVGETAPVYVLEAYPSSLPSDLSLTAPSAHLLPSFPEVYWTVSK